MRSLSKLMAEAVREQGGVVQNFTGDGIMAVFGARSHSKMHLCGLVAQHCRS
jgi:class 3 adenylate cyclase